MKNITDLSLSMIAKYCKALIHLDVQECSHISDYGISIVSQECKLLEILNLNGCNLTNNFVDYLCFYNQSIKDLDLRNTKVNDVAIGKIISTLFNLESLKISGLSLNNVNMNHLLNLKSLKNLDISFCYDIKKDLLQDIIRSCSNLQEVHLFGLISSEEKQALSNMKNEISIFC